MSSFKVADEEFAPIAKELYLKHKEELDLTVDPSRIFFLRSDKKTKQSKRRRFAYCKLISREYELLTTNRFFIVIMSENYDTLSDAEKKYVILHELKHLDYDDEKEKYHLLNHNLEDFHELVINPNWNLEMVKQ